MRQDFWIGDCLELMNNIPDKSIDMIFCDMPYGTTRCKWDSPINLKTLWGHYNRISKDNCAIVLTAQTPFDKVLGNSNLNMLRYEWIWEKTSATGYFNVKKCPMKAHENVLVFYKNLPTYNPQKTSGHVRKTARKRIELNSEVYNNNTSETFYDSTERYPRSVLKFASDKQKENIHPTQKPYSLVEYFVKTYSNEGDLILDNCAGSGTTAIVCRNLNRQFIMIEKDQKIFDTMKNRYNP